MFGYKVHELSALSQTFVLFLMKWEKKGGGVEPAGKHLIITQVGKGYRTDPDTGQSIN